MNEKENKDLDYFYDVVENNYQYSIKCILLGAIFSNLSVLLLLLVGLLKSDNRISMIIFLIGILFFILENNLAICRIYNYCEKVNYVWEEYKEKINSNKNAYFYMPKDNASSWYVLSLVIELLFVIFGYMFL